MPIDEKMLPFTNVAARIWWISKQHVWVLNQTPLKCASQRSEVESRSSALGKEARHTGLEQETSRKYNTPTNDEMCTGSHGKSNWYNVDAAAHNSMGPLKQEQHRCEDSRKHRSTQHQCLTAERDTCFNRSDSARCVKNLRRLIHIQTCGEKETHGVNLLRSQHAFQESQNTQRIFTSLIERKCVKSKPKA